MRNITANDLTTGAIRLQTEQVDDFFAFNTGDLWTSVLSDSGTAATLDAANGILRLLPSDGTVADNDEAYVRTTKEVVLFANDKPVAVYGRIRITEANTDDANVAFGLADAVAANTLQDNGAGPPASYSGAVIFKADGDTFWSCESSLAGTQTTTKSSLAVSSGTFVDFRVEVTSVSATIQEVRYYANGNLMTDFTTGDPICHQVTLGSPTEMTVFVGVKNGGANQETLDVDYLGWTNLR